MAQRLTLSVFESDFELAALSTDRALMTCYRYLPSSHALAMLFLWTKALMLTVGHEYTRNEIHAELGGSKVSCLPTRGGRIVAACLSRTFSPAAPTVVLCGQGQRTGAVSKALTLQAGKIPVFIKRAAGRWEFFGNFEVVESFSSGLRFESFIHGSGRLLSSVSHVVLLRPSP